MCDGPEEPPPGRFGFKKHAGLIRVNTVYRDEDSIFDQTYQKQICSYFYYDEF